MTPLLACLLAAAILQFFGPEKVKFNFFFLTVPNRPSAVVGNLFKLRCPYPMVLLPGIGAGALCVKNQHPIFDQRSRVHHANFSDCDSTFHPTRFAGRIVDVDQAFLPKESEPGLR